MILGFAVPDDFSHSGSAALMQSCRELQAAYPQIYLEFFYYLRPSDKDRYFFIRAGEDFAPGEESEIRARAGKIFAAQHNFIRLSENDCFLKAGRLQISSFR